MNTALTRACADCEVEFGVMNRRDATKTHGICRRHFVTLVMRCGRTQEEAEQSADGLGRSGFCPDLAQTGVILNPGHQAALNGGVCCGDCEGFGIREDGVACFTCHGKGYLVL